MKTENKNKKYFHKPNALLIFWSIQWNFFTFFLGGKRVGVGQQWNFINQTHATPSMWALSDPFKGGRKKNSVLVEGLVKDMHRFGSEDRELR